MLLRKGFPGGSEGKETSCNAGDPGSIPRLGRSPEEGKDYQLQYPHLENTMDCIVQGVTKSQTQLSNSHFTSQLITKSKKKKEKKKNNS